MAKSTTTLAQAHTKTRERSPAEIPQKVRNANATPGRRGKVGLTVYVWPEAHSAIKRVSEKTGKKIEDLLKEGLNLILQDHHEKQIV